MDHQQQSKPFAAIRSSAIDGRVHNAFFRRSQLKKLHQLLVKNASELQNSMSEDGTLTPPEIKIDYLLALQCVAHAHEIVDPHKALADEYVITKGKDAPEARIPVGIVVVEPSRNGFLYSLISVLVPALAAGNCIIVECVNQLGPVPRLALDIVGSALDNDIFSVSNRPVARSELAHPHIRVVQDPPGSVKEDRYVLAPIPSNPVIALVERDAQVEEAARALVAARFGRGGKSPYAPDVVLVNEWVKKRFVKAAVQYKGALDADDAYIQDGGSKQKDFVKNIEEEDSVIISTGARGTIMDVRNRRSAVFKRKIQHPCLVIHGVKSMDDAINVAKTLGHLAAAYVYAMPPAAKYFCQFINTSATFVNQVPTKLLYGPMAPAGYTLHPGNWSVYDPSMFTAARPQFITVSKVDQQLQGISQGHPSQVADLNNLIAQASAELVDVKRPSHVSPLGFFEQGIITGLSMLLVTVVGGMGVSGYLFLRYYHSN